MASLAQEPGLVTITIDGTELQVPKGELVVESVKRLGREIPIFCYHPRMKPVGMCRMCLVEVGMKQPDGTVRMMPKPQAGCTLPASDNLVVITDSESVIADRRGVLEFLLINHPLDCPICDRGGECPLQNNTLFYGPSTTRYVEVKRHLPKAFPLSRHVTLDLERCIQCGRCVRFTEEISGDAQLAFLFRGAAMTPRTFELTDLDSKFSGNVIEICPVGALTSSDYRFRARPWDLETRPSTCLECANGCSVWFDHRGGKMVRINGRVNDAVNEEWTCDKGKFGHGYLNAPDRPTKPLARKEDVLAAADWTTVYQQIVSRFEDGRAAVAGLVGAKVSNEDLFQFKRMFHRHFHSPNLDHRWTRILPSQTEGVRGLHGIDEVHTRIAEWESVNAALVVGNDLASDQPMVYLRLRKAWQRHGAKVVVISERPTYADHFASAVIRCEEGKLFEAVARLSAAVLQNREGADALRAALKPFAPDAKDRAAAEALKGEFFTVCSESVYAKPDGGKTVSALANLAVGTDNAQRFNLYPVGANDMGAALLGVHPGGQGMNTREILEGCIQGRIKSLWLLECDPFALWHDHQQVQDALENVEFLVVQTSAPNQAMQYASVVLPCCAHVEADGTYTNIERRVQKIEAIWRPKGDAKPSWKLFTELMLRMNPSRPIFEPSELMEMIIAEDESFAPAAYHNLEGNGACLPLGVDAGAQLFMEIYQ